MSTPASFKPCINLLYEISFILAAALILVIHNFLKSLFLSFLPTYAYDNFNEMYDAYHALGGNGMVTKMKNEIELLHLQSKEGS